MSLMKEKIELAIQNALHYLHDGVPYSTDYETYIHCGNREFLEAIKVQISGEIQEHPDFGLFLNFKI
jgi:hypothetical protein